MLLKYICKGNLELINFLSFVQENNFSWGNESFGFKWVGKHPALYIANFQIYVYALCIVAGMICAILTAAYLFKKRGYDPYDVTIYALVLIPVGVLGARAYVYIFPWEDTGVADWSTFFEFRNGGLGIYGGVIMGFVAAYVLCKIKKQDFRIIVDTILPGVMIAQCLGRWGNYANMEAYGELITSDYSAMPNFMEFLGNGADHGFNLLAVWIPNGKFGDGWYEATFFYESFCTFIGYLVCMLILIKCKKYRIGWCSAFYGIYYGTIRLIIESMRTDSLYLYVGTYLTDIKISQLVSVFAVFNGLWTLSQVYRKEIHALYRRMFKTERQEVSLSRWFLCALIAVCIIVSTIMFTLGGEGKILIGCGCICLAVYSIIGFFALCDRLKLYCDKCGQRKAYDVPLQSDYDKYKTKIICYCIAFALSLAFGVFSLVHWGILSHIPNGTVLFVVIVALDAALCIWGIVPSIQKMLLAIPQHIEIETKCDCGTTKSVRLNNFLLFVFPPKVYLDYSVDNIKPYVEPEKTK